MIGWLRGAVRARKDDRLVVDVNGVGYVVQVPLGAGAHLELEAEVEKLSTIMGRVIQQQQTGPGGEDSAF